MVGWVVLVAATPAPDRSRQLIRIAIATLGAAILIGASEPFRHLTDSVVDAARHTDGDWMSAIACLSRLSPGWSPGGPTGSHRAFAFPPAL